MNNETLKRKNIREKRIKTVARKKKIILSCTVISLLFIAVYSSVRFVNVNANNTEKNPIYKYYTSYEIRPGDTLTSIAQEHTVNSNVSVNEYIAEVKKNNNLTTDKITSGNYLVISYYSNEYK